MPVADATRAVAAFPAHPELERSWGEAWRETVAAAPDAVAIAAEAATLLRADLDRRADVLAAAVVAATPDAGPVATLLGHDPTAVVALLAVLKSGRPLVALDPETPPARLTALLEASAAEAVVVDGERRGLAETLRAATGPAPALLEVTPAGSGGSAEPAGPPLLPRPSPGDPASIVFTSGTTGRPRGVVCDHRTMLHDAWVRSREGWCAPGDALALLLPVSFGLGVGELLSGLLSGAALHLYDPRSRGITPLAGWLEERAVTVLAATPTLLRSLVDTLGEGQRLASSLRLVRSGGERFLAVDAVAVRDRLPAGARLLNVFGASETCLLTNHDVVPGTPATPVPLPAGRPLADKQLRVLREDGSRAAAGERGELVVASRYVATGYWRDPAATRERFAELGDGVREVATGDLAVVGDDGCLQLAGRRDFTLKVRGVRVEPAEVEAALLAAAGVREAVVAGVEAQDGDVRLVAYVVPAAGARVRPAELRAGLRRQLPGPLVPATVVVLEALPRTERGKVDRGALPPPPPSPPSAPARGDRERLLTELWSAVLAVAEVGRDDDFFSLGGDSLAVEELLALVEARWGVRLHSRAVAEAPTPAALSRRLPERRGGPRSGQSRASRLSRHLPRRAHQERGAQRERAARSTLVPLQTGGDRPPLFVVAGAGGLGVSLLPLARRLGSDQPVYALQARGLEPRGLPDRSVAAAARRHLREVRAVQPTGPYLLAGHSVGGVTAFEMAQQLRAAGEEVALLAMLDSWAPDPAAHPVPRLRGPLHRLLRPLVLATTGMVPYPTRLHFFRFTSLGAELARRYRGRPWPGRLLLLFAEDAAVPREAAWASFTAGVCERYAVRGTHLSMLREPAVADTASRLRQAMDTAAPPSRSSRAPHRRSVATGAVRPRQPLDAAPTPAPSPGAGSTT